MKKETLTQINEKLNRQYLGALKTVLVFSFVIFFGIFSVFRSFDGLILATIITAFFIGISIFSLVVYFLIEISQLRKEYHNPSSKYSHISN